jgi:hypothetical protein
MNKLIRFKKRVDTDYHALENNDIKKAPADLPESKAQGVNVDELLESPMNIEEESQVLDLRYKLALKKYEVDALEKGVLPANLVAKYAMETGLFKVLSAIVKMIFGL